MGEILRVLSLGAGVQSSTLALMAAAGEVAPAPEFAVFADTQAEPPSVYEWLDWLRERLPFPVYTVSRGNLAEDSTRVRTSAAGGRYTKHGIPAFTLEPSGHRGIATRQCTEGHKISVIYREYRKHRHGRRVEQWIGISTDEASRMKDARVPWCDNRWPLIELRMSRRDCLDWMRAHGHPTPPRSACVFCPYHSNAEWLRLKVEDPPSFDAAVAYEKRYQSAMAQIERIRSVPYLHRSCLPLEEVDFEAEQEKARRRQTMPLFDSFTYECEGMCGV